MNSLSIYIFLHYPIVFFIIPFSKTFFILFFINNIHIFFNLHLLFPIAVGLAPTSSILFQSCSTIKLHNSKFQSKCQYKCQRNNDNTQKQQNNCKQESKCLDQIQTKNKSQQTTYV